MLIDNAHLVKDGIAYVLSDVLEILTSKYFATSAGQDLTFLMYQCRHYQIDILEIEITQ
jgi:hypothetical protein